MNIYGRDIEVVKATADDTLKLEPNELGLLVPIERKPIKLFPAPVQSTTCPCGGIQ